jgi:Tol biopolymer transport system component
VTQAEWQRVWAVVESASELPPESRESFVEQSLPDPSQCRRALELLSESDDGAPEDPAPADATADWPLLGKSLHRFEIVGPIGRGGMGEVYRAFDPDLGRYVAIKSIAGRRLGTSSAVSNFTREARLASSLNHPGIVTIHEVIRTDETVAIVMELAEGDTLRKLCGAPQPLESVAGWGKQIAGSLAALHAAGLVHRDLKPENLMLRPDGMIKVLDFGLARRQADRAETNGERPAGTLRYMSPEQALASGSLTPASDIFSLGVVLYELATGVHPFTFEERDNTTVSIAAAVAAQTARPPSTAAPSLPRAFDSLIVRMLDKDPAQRPAADAVIEALTHLPNAKLGRRRMVWGVSLAIGGLVAAFGLRAFFAPAPEPTLLSGNLLTGAPGRESDPAFSLDGRSIAYAWDGGSGGKRDIWIKPLDATDPHRLTSDPEDDWDPCWLADGTGIAFLRNTPSAYEVVTVPLGGGPERRVTTIGNKYAWIPNRLACPPEPGQLVIADELQDGRGRIQLLLVSTSTGARRGLSDPTEGTNDFRPRISPDGRRIAFVRSGSGYEVRVVEMTGGPSRLLLPKVTYLKGLAWTANGRNLLYQGGAGDPKNLWQIPASGGEPRRPPFLTEANAEQIALSPDGRQVAYSRGGNDVNLVRVFADARPPAEWAPSTRIESDGVWSPDGSMVAFSSDRSGSAEIWVASAAGTNARRLTHLNGRCGSPAWSPDGKWLAFDTSGAGGVQIGIVPAEGGAVRVLTDGPKALLPSWSRDGKWIYFCSSRSGKGQVWRMPASGGAAVQVTRQGGFESHESSDGRFLYYSKAGEDGVWKIAVSGEGVEEKVADLDPKIQFRCWDLGTDGIYVARPGPPPGIDLLPFAGGRRQVSILPSELPKYSRCLSANPDGQSFLFPVRSADQWQIYVADNPAAN